MQANESKAVMSATSSIVEALEPLNEEQRLKALEMARTFFGMKSSTQLTGGQAKKDRQDGQPDSPDKAEEDPDETPKSFLNRKKPKSDTERIACLGYYLATFRGTCHFKTSDLTNLNTEAAQGTMTNPSMAADNAVKQGYLAPAGKGNRQMAARGEAVVIALPDREAVRKARSEHRVKRKRAGKKEKPSK